MRDILKGNGILYIVGSPETGLKQAVVQARDNGFKYQIVRVPTGSGWHTHIKIIL